MQIVAEPVAAAPATLEKLALNNSAQAAQTPVANSADAEKLAKIEPDTSAAAVQTTGSDIESAVPSAPASTAAATEPRTAADTAEPDPQASDKAVESSQTEVAGKIEVPAVASTPATTPATKVEIA